MKSIVNRKVATAKAAFQNGGASALAVLVKNYLQLLRARAIGIEIDGCRFKVRRLTKDFWHGIVSGEYESSERQAIRQYLDPRHPVIELGGCLGVVTCILNRFLESPRMHVVVDASPECARTIKANAARNKCDVVVVNAAIAYNCDNVVFWVNPDRPYSNALQPIHPGCSQISVPATTLKALCEEYGVSGCSLVCDIEGQEYEMVKNELPLIAQCVTSMILETHPRLIGTEKTEEMLAALASVGFQIRDVIDDVYVLMRPQGRS